MSFTDHGFAGYVIYETPCNWQNHDRQDPLPINCKNCRILLNIVLSFHLLINKMSIAN